jgi:L-ornithine N5-oxygenase
VELTADVLVCATGYRPADPAGVLGAADAHCQRDDRGRLRVARDYRVCTTPELRGGLYLQGGTEHTHGISSSLLSNAAVRAGGRVLGVGADGTRCAEVQVGRAMGV